MRLKSIAVFLLSCLVATAGTVTPTWTWTDFGINPLSVRRVTLTPLRGPASGSGSTNFSAQPMVQLTGTNGSVTFTNIANNYSYALRVQGPSLDTTVTNYFPSAASGAVDARDYEGVWTGTVFAYFNQQSGGSASFFGTPSTVVYADADSNLTSLLLGFGLDLDTATGTLSVTGVQATNAVSKLTVGGVPLSNDVSLVFQNASRGTNGVSVTTAGQIATVTIAHDTNVYATVSQLTNQGALNTNAFVNQEGNATNITSRPNGLSLSQRWLDNSGNPRAYVDSSGVFFFAGGLTSSGSTTLSGDTTISGNSTFSGTASFDNGVNMGGVGGGHAAIPVINADGSLDTGYFTTLPTNGLAGFLPDWSRYNTNQFYSTNANVQVGSAKLTNFAALANSAGALTNDGAGNLSWVAVGGGGGGAITNTLVNVRDFGALGDGSTDDVAAFRSAQQRANGTNGVYVPAGTYMITGPLIWTNNLMVGAGSGVSVLKLKNGGVSQTHLIYATNTAGGQVFRDLGFNGGTNLDFSDSSPASVLWGITHSCINNAEISRCNFDGFYAPLYIIGANSIGTRPQNALYAFNTTTNAYYGIWLSTSNNAEYVRIEGNAFMHNQIGIQNDSAANAIVVGNRVTDCGSYALYADGTGAASGGGGSGRGHSDYIGNTFGHMASGIKLFALSYVVLKNNIIGGGQGSIQLTLATNCVVSDNFLQLGASGVVVTAGQSNYFANNQWISTPARTYDPTNCLFQGNINFTGGSLPIWESYASAFSVSKTITTAGTTGGQTIDKASGSVNFAASATSVVVTDSLVTANSVIHCTIATDDATAVLKSVVPGSGSFTINMKVAPTAETRVNFLVTN